MSDAYQLNATETSFCGNAITVDSQAGQWLTERGLAIETAHNLGIGESDGALIIPFKRDGVVYNRKFRALDSKKFWQDGGKQFVFNYDALKLEGPVLITEGEIDCISAIQAGYPKTISVPNGGVEGEPNIDWLEEIYNSLGGEVILAFDNDDVGAAFLERIANYIGKARTKWVSYPKGCKDLNDALRKYKEDGVQESIKRARWYDMKGAYSMSELPPLPYREPMSADMPYIDDIMRIRLGDFSVLTGIPGHGKSAFITDYINRIVDKYDIRACIASFESPPQTDLKRDMRTWKYGKLEKYMTDEEKADADQWIDRRYMFIVPDDDDDVTLEWLIARMEAVVLRHNCSIIIIDPWNEMDHERPPGMSLTEYTGNAIKMLKKFAKSRGVHVMVVAHPAKLNRNKNGDFPIPQLYDISDSAQWSNKPDLGIVVHRDEKNGDTVRTVKSRYHNEIGAPGIVETKFNPQSGRFTAIESEAWKFK